MILSQHNCYDWQPIQSPTFGQVLRPIVPIEIRAKSGEWKIFYPEVDSGAVISVFNKSDCELLGLKLTDGKHFELKGALSGSTPAYIHDVEMILANEAILSRVAFTDAKNHKQLLGRIDIFNKFLFSLGGKSLKTWVAKA